MDDQHKRTGVRLFKPESKPDPELAKTAEEAADRAFNPTPVASVVEVEYYEYDCGRPCTENGCPGHETDIPVAIVVNDVLFHVDGAERGDFLAGDNEHIKRVQDAVEAIQTALPKTPVRGEPLDVSKLGYFVDHTCADGSLQTIRVGKVCQLCGYGGKNHGG